MIGIIAKGIAGFYYVWADDGLYECKARGKFRNKGLIPMVGDRVELCIDKMNTPSNPAYLPGTIDRILPRINELERPPIANAEVIVIVAAAKEPKPLPYVIDRMAVAAETKHAKVAICINKDDLEKQDNLLNTYKGIYPVFSVSAKNGNGIEKLKAFIKGYSAALAGPSGVGKSSLTNALLGTCVETGDISRKTQRGKNTTRHSELFKGDGFFLFDTPGFTSFETPEIDLLSLDLYFPEFRERKVKCRFSDCTHQNEPDCAVKEAVEKGEISKSRYESFVSMYKEIKDRSKF